MNARALVTVVALAGAACTGGNWAPPDGGAGGGTGGGAGPLQPLGTLDKVEAQRQFATTTELMRYVVAPGCAAERNECHNSEDFPDLSTEGNLWNLVDVRCNQGLGERRDVEGFCENLGDELRIEGGANQGFTARIGSISSVSNAQGVFQHYEVLLDKAPTASQTGASFGILRDGAKVGGLGGGASVELKAGEKWARVKNASHLPSPSLVFQGDENRDGAFGDGKGVLVKRGDARASYLVWRVLGHSPRPQMPLGTNADQVTETNRPLTKNEVYALMSWVNCMQAGDTIYSPIRYDCAANANNEGQW